MQSLQPHFSFSKIKSQAETLNRKLTEHEHGLENSKYCSNHYAVLRGGKKVTITG